MNNEIKEQSRKDEKNKKRPSYLQGRRWDHRFSPKKDQIRYGVKRLNLTRKGPGCLTSSCVYMKAYHITASAVGFSLPSLVSMFGPA